MKRLEKNELQPIFSTHWSELQDEFFKLETLQHYIEEEVESYNLYLRGRKNEARKLLQKAISSQAPLYENTRNRGVSMLRLHIVDLPLSPYISYELESYKISRRFGEEIYFVTTETVDTIDTVTPPQDLLMFDERFIILHSYDRDGFLQYSDLLEDPSEVQPFVTLKKQLLAEAMSFDEFLDTTRRTGE